MTEELKDLAKVDKDQPLSGDSLELLQAAQARRARILQALRSRGFYDSRVTATINNQPIEDAAALDAIEAMPENQKADFVFNVATGPVYRVTDLEIQGPPELVNYPPLDRSKLSLIPGQPADAAAGAAPGTIPTRRQYPGRRPPLAAQARSAYRGPGHVSSSSPVPDAPLRSSPAEVTGCAPGVPRIS